VQEGSNNLEKEQKNNLEYEKRLRQLRRRMRETDWAWLSACMGVVEGDSNPVEAYLNGGGDPTRKLTHSEATLLGRPGVYEQGHTLVHLAVKLHREDMLATLLSQMESFTAPVVKRVPSYVAPDLAAAIRRQVALALRQRKGPLPCFYLSDCATYSLPPELEDLPRATQQQLLDELLDRDAQVGMRGETCCSRVRRPSWRRRW
jgi:ubiquitin thioesterase ZRANB1